MITTTFGENSDDPLCDPACLARSIQWGILDAPQLKNNPVALGSIKTMPINGGYDAIDAQGKILSETKRLQKILGTHRSEKLR